MAIYPATMDKAALAAEVWRELFDFILATSPRRNQVLATLGITPNDSRALYALDASRGRSMRDLASSWDTDASTVTWIVDRLESKGLAERRPHPTDRRVKLVTLTREGVRVRAKLMRGTYEPPLELFALDEETLEVLRDALRPLNAAATQTTDPEPVANDLNGAAAARAGSALRR